ncbi:hypothetical protein H920_02450 [Fukomys damarensis]|uniref:Uncharacterized protein n=1 Tax=Fukomys damarensis TaxID=885580 RepID=A0A091E0P7_FUKDA|nr:hypothetical protein H920_02450 [Fukomys damarensis]
MLDLQVAVQWTRDSTVVCTEQVAQDSDGHQGGFLEEEVRTKPGAEDEEGLVLKSGEGVFFVEVSRGWQFEGAQVASHGTGEQDEIERYTSSTKVPLDFDGQAGVPPKEELSRTLTMGSQVNGYRYEEVND